MVRVVDVVTFFNELDLLEYRLRYMSPHVDTFVIVEATTSFIGNPKPKVFDEKRFSEWMDKIKYVQVVLPQTKEELAKYDRAVSRNQCGDAWIREYAQREACRDAVMALGLDDGDIVLSSDVDEMPNLPAVFRRFNPRAVNVLRQHMFNQCIHMYRSCWPWSMASATCYSVYKQYHPDQLRLHLGLKHPLNYIDDAGWHFSYFGSATRMHVKMNNFSHQEEAVQQYNKLEHLRSCVKNHVFHRYDVNDRGTHHDVLKGDLSDFKGTKPPLLDEALTRFAYCAVEDL